MRDPMRHTEAAPDAQSPREGELYRTVTTFGETFSLHYGYYDEGDRQNPLCQPAVIYPDFISAPRYTREGEPFVTVMQSACEHYEGEPTRTEDTSCADCRHFRQGEEWFGICRCPQNRRRE